jgi:hypothetical protein
MEEEMEEIKTRKVERTQYYWKCPDCGDELKGNGIKTLKHLINLHKERYCKSLNTSKED